MIGLRIECVAYMSTYWEDRERINGEHGSAGTCTSDLSTCLSDKSSLTTSLATCTADKSALQISLTAAQNAVPNVTVWHYGPGNFYTETYQGKEYRVIDYNVPGRLKTALIGLDYNGGDDAFFGPGVIPGLVRWYTMTSLDGRLFTSNIDDTVVIDLNAQWPNRPLKVKKDEFAAGTSKEGFAIKRVIAIYVQ